MESQIIITTETQLKQIVSEAVSTIIANNKFTIDAPKYDPCPFGDIEWLYSIFPSSISKNTIKQMSATNRIPGKIKFGKRVIYDKIKVIDNIRKQANEIISLEELDLKVEKQFSHQLTKRRTPKQ